MSGNSRFSFTNHIETATLKNGTGAPAPALDEDADYPMTNSQTRWRGKLWKQDSGASMTIEFDLGSNKSFACAALLGHRPTSGSGNGITSAIVNVSTSANGYPPSSGNPWTALGVISMASAARDGGIVFPSGSYRYIQFDITCFDAFTLGRCYCGALTDLGVVYAPDSEEFRIQPRQELVTPAGQVFAQWAGDAYERWELGFDPTDASLRSSLRTLHSKKQSLVYVDYNDSFREVILGQEIGGPHRFNNPQRWEYRVPMVSLG